MHDLDQGHKHPYNQHERAHDHRGGDDGHHQHDDGGGGGDGRSFLLHRASSEYARGWALPQLFSQMQVGMKQTEKYFRLTHQQRPPVLKQKTS